jgi:hypothetical protein
MVQRESLPSRQKGKNMNHYLVFFGRRGDKSIVWRAEENPAGVFEGETPAEACQAASAYLGVMGSFYAVEGTYWGVLPGNTPKPFGTSDSMDDKLTQLIKVAQNRLLAEGKAAPELEGEGVDE